MNTHKIIIVLIIITLCSCNQQNTQHTNSFENKSTEKPTDIIVKTWVYISNNVYVSSFIRINSDSTFNYENTGCMGTCYSSGKWTLKGNQLVLNSFENYSEKNMSEPIVETITPKANVKTTEEKNVKNKINADTTTSIVFSKISLTTIVNATLSSRLDSSKTFFKDRLFILENDTLYELMGHIGNRSGSKYIAPENR